MVEGVVLSIALDKMREDRHLFWPPQDFFGTSVPNIWTGTLDRAQSCNRSFMKMRILTRPLFALVAALGTILFASGATPPPGGANQAAGVEGTLAKPVFNGFVRIKSTYFGAPRPTDTLPTWAKDPPPADKQALVFIGVISNGRSEAFIDDPSFKVADADGIIADTRAMDPTTFNLPQAAGSRVTVVFWAPKDFVPDHILFTCQATKCKPIRIQLPHS